ncbi:MAG: HEAT repeat domain-containing protein [Candidatus Aminicenantes bacterium]|nr:HEAT repeat domain-containing protein [Candidatus Aminicenantes bacterium]
MTIKKRTNSLDVDYSILVDKYFASVNKVEVYVGDIPDKKLNKATQLWAKKMSTAEKNLVLIDDTVFGSVKNGILLTSNACYYRSDQGKGSFQYSEIDSFTRNKAYPKNGIDVITKDGMVHKLYLIVNKKILPSIEAFFSSALVNKNRSETIFKEKTDTKTATGQNELDKSKDKFRKNNHEPEWVSGVIFMMIGLVVIGFSIYFFRQSGKGLLSLLLLFTALLIGLLLVIFGCDTLTKSPVNKVKNITDKKVLAEIAKNHKHPIVRREAVKKIDNQTVLTDIAKNAEDEYVRKRAVKKITDKKVLAEIAKNDKHTIVRREAVKKIDSQIVLADIAKSDESIYVRRRAVEKISDQTVLARIAKNDKDEDIFKTSLERISDKAILADVAKKAKYPSFRISAVEKINDQRVFVEIAKNDEDELVRRKATEKLTNQTILKEIAQKDKDQFVRKAAVEKLNDQELLADIAKNDESEIVRSAAKVTELDGIIIIFDREFSDKTVFVNSILSRMEARGKSYKEWMTSKTPVEIIVNSKALDPNLFITMAAVTFRRLGIDFDYDRLEYADLSGTHNISGVVITHWKSKN